jgi:hypothetical protein
VELLSQKEKELVECSTHMQDRAEVVMQLAEIKVREAQWNTDNVELQARLNAKQVRASFVVVVTSHRIASA